MYDRVNKIRGKTMDAEIFIRRILGDVKSKIDWLHCEYNVKADYILMNPHDYFQFTGCCDTSFNRYSQCEEFLSNGQLFGVKVITSEGIDKGCIDVVIKNKMPSKIFTEEQRSHAK